MPSESRALGPDEYWLVDAWHSTTLRDGLKLTGQSFYARHVAPDRAPFEPTEAMRQGSLVDAYITEPATFDQRYVVRPLDLPKRPTASQLTTGESSKPGTKIRAAWEDAQAREAEWLAWEKEAAGRETIPAIWLEAAQRIRDRLLLDPDIGPRLRDATPNQQVGWLWVDPQLGPCVYKPDLVTNAGGLWDLKKMRSAHPRAAQRQAIDLAYDVQLDHYYHGYVDQHWGTPSEIGLIVYEFDPPFDYALMPATTQFMQLGAERRAKAFARIKEWEETCTYPSYGTTDLTVPAWMTDSKGEQPEPMPMESIALF